VVETGRDGSCCECFRCVFFFFRFFTLVIAEIAPFSIRFQALSQQIANAIESYPTVSFQSLMVSLHDILPLAAERNIVAVVEIVYRPVVETVVSCLYSEINSANCKRERIVYYYHIPVSRGEST
jgi:hypothetical protein